MPALDRQHLPACYAVRMDMAGGRAGTRNGLRRGRRARRWLPSVASLAVALSLALAAYSAGCAKKAPPGLEQLGRVSDYANVLSPETEATLAEELDRYERETCHNVAVLTVPSLKGETIAALAERTALAWGIVEPVLKDGILLALAIEDGQARFVLGTALQGMIDQGAAERILREEMVPAFRRKDFDTGVAQGIRAMMGEARKLEIPEGLRPAVCRR